METPHIIYDSAFAQDMAALEVARKIICKLEQQAAGVNKYAFDLLGHVDKHLANEQLRAGKEYFAPPTERKAFPAIFEVEPISVNGEMESNGQVHFFCTHQHMDEYEMDPRQPFRYGQSADYIEGTVCQQCGKELVNAKD